MLKRYDQSNPPLQPVRMFLYGPLRTGKTFFAGGMPHPVFITPAIEGGDTTLRMNYYDRDYTVLQVESSQDMRAALAVVKNEHRKRGWRSVVIDPVGAYADIFVEERRKMSGAKFGQQDWGVLEQHLMGEMVPALHSLPMHVVWIAHDKVVKDQETGQILRIEPMIPGQTATKLPRLCDLYAYATRRVATTPSKDGQPAARATHYLLRIKPQGHINAGTRFDNVLVEDEIPSDWGFLADRIGPYIANPDDVIESSNEAAAEAAMEVAAVEAPASSRRTIAPPGNGTVKNAPRAVARR